MFRDPRRVRIVEEKIEGMEHSVFIERVADGVVLGKYRSSERLVINGKESTVTGRKAALLACKANRWPVAA